MRGRPCAQKGLDPRLGRSSPGVDGFGSRVYSKSHLIHSAIGPATNPCSSELNVRENERPSGSLFQSSVGFPTYIVCMYWAQHMALGISCYYLQRILITKLPVEWHTHTQHMHTHLLNLCLQFLHPISTQTNAQNIITVLLVLLARLSLTASG